MVRGSIGLMWWWLGGVGTGVVRPLFCSGREHLNGLVWTRDVRGSEMRVPPAHQRLLICCAALGWLGWTGPFRRWGWGGSLCARCLPRAAALPA